MNKNCWLLFFVTLNAESNLTALNDLVALFSDKKINIPSGIFKWNGIDLSHREDIKSKVKEIVENSVNQLEQANLNLEILADMASVALDRSQLVSDQNVIMMVDALAQRDKENQKIQTYPTTTSSCYKNSCRWCCCN